MRVASVSVSGSSIFSAYAARMAPTIWAAMYTPAIAGSIRRAARNPMVTAGLKWPEMRIVALTMTARMVPWASAATINALSMRLAVAAMMDPLPTNTSAKVPTNSATKWRNESRMTGGGGRLVRLFQDHGGIDAAESE